MFSEGRADDFTAGWNGRQESEESMMTTGFSLGET